MLLSIFTAIAIVACAQPREKLAWPFPPAPPKSIPHNSPTDPPKNKAAMGGVMHETDEIDGELDNNNLANTSSDSQTDATPNFQWPMIVTTITSLFGNRIDPIDGKHRFHSGIDIDGKYGTLIRAAASGTIVFTGWDHGHGRKVVIKHAAGFSTSYSHLAQTIALPGTHVKAGEVIGQLGNSGRSTGSHLHFEVRRWNVLLDPLDVLASPAK